MYDAGSSFKDTRYKPLTVGELGKLHIQVSLLSCHEKLGPGEWNNWVLGTHGITIEFKVKGRQFTGTYLPQIPVEEGAFDPLYQWMPIYLLLSH